MCTLIEVCFHCDVELRKQTRRTMPASASGGGELNVQHEGLVFIGPLVDGTARADLISQYNIRSRDGTAMVHRGMAASFAVADAHIN